MKRARVLLASSDAAGALSDATAVVDVVAGQSPETAAGALALRSEAHMQLRDYESAFNDLRRAAALSPSMVRKRERRGLALASPRRRHGSTGGGGSLALQLSSNRSHPMPAARSHSLLPPLAPPQAGSLVKRMREAASAALGSSKGARDGHSLPSRAPPLHAPRPDGRCGRRTGRRPPSDTGSAASASSGGEGSQRGAAAGEERSGRAAAALPRFYRILGVGLDATEADISRGYRKMAAKWHPDKWVGSGEDRVEARAHPPAAAASLLAHAADARHLAH